MEKQSYLCGFGRPLVPLIAFTCLIFPAVHYSVLGQTPTEEQIEEEITVTGEEVPSAYGAPPGISRRLIQKLKWTSPLGSSGTTER